MRRGTFKQPTYEEKLLKAKTAQIRRQKVKMTESTTKRVKTPQNGKSKARRPRKVTVTQLKKKLWEECKRIVRKTYISDDGVYRCFTCGKLIENMSSVHTSHFIPSAACGAYLRYDLRNLRICCYFCNVNLGGNGAVFYRRLVETEGQEYVDKLFTDKNISIKADLQWYQSKIDECKLL